VTVTASKAGYLLSFALGTAAPGPSRTVELKAGVERQDVRLALVPEGRISGTVRDERGEPIVSVDVHLIRRETGSDRVPWQPAGSARTDDRGIYQRAGLRPGSYLVVLPAQVGGRGTGARTRPAVYAPASRTASGATEIALAPGATRGGVDLTADLSAFANLPRVPVSGRLVGAATPLPPTMMVRLVPFGVPQTIAHLQWLSAPVQAEGQFTFPDVPAGPYRVVTWQYPAGAGVVALPADRPAPPGGWPIRVIEPNGVALPPPPSSPTWMADVPLHVEPGMGPAEVALQTGAAIMGRRQSAAR
jgi:hypothetical protein